MQRLSIGLFACVALLYNGIAGADGNGADRRRDALVREIARLEAELKGLTTAERGVLGELERLGAELRLNAARLSEAEARLEKSEERLREREARLENLGEDRDRRRRYLTFRLRELYKAGPATAWRRALEPGDDPDAFVAGMRYALFLTRRDATVLERLRQDAADLEVERAAVVRERDSWVRAGSDSSAARAALNRSIDTREETLAEIRRDQTRRRGALEELASAATELSGLVRQLSRPEPDAGTMDMSKFEGLLDWPAEGEVRAGFGNVVHPRFRTRVPHPGMDIGAEEGSPFRAVFEGYVVYASWLRGYGLTAIVDHGRGMMSVYAHASVLLVEQGQRVVTGETLGLVGDTGSLEGAVLYFEIRRDGQPVDPSPWLRRP